MMGWGWTAKKMEVEIDSNIIPKVGNIVAMESRELQDITDFTPNPIFSSKFWLQNWQYFLQIPKKHHSRSLFTSKENWQLHASSHVQSYLLLGVQISKNILFQADTCGALVLALFAIDHFGMSVIGDSRSVVILQWFILSWNRLIPPNFKAGLTMMNKQFSVVKTTKSTSSTSVGGCGWFA